MPYIGPAASKASRRKVICLLHRIRLRPGRLGVKNCPECVAEARAKVAKEKSGRHFPPGLTKG